MVSFRRLFALACAVFLLLLLSRSCTSVASASSGLEARLSRLEAENFQLRSQVNRLETQVNRLSGLSSRDRPAPTLTPTPPPRVPSQSMLGEDPMFKRLATLVIELKERVAALEAKVEELESSR